MDSLRQWNGVSVIPYIQCGYKVAPKIAHMLMDLSIAGEAVEVTAHDGAGCVTGQMPRPVQS